MICLVVLTSLLAQGQCQLQKIRLVNPTPHTPDSSGTRRIIIPYTTLDDNILCYFPPVISLRQNFVPSFSRDRKCISSSVKKKKAFSAGKVLPTQLSSEKGSWLLHCFSSSLRS